jgi:hypothetical protein
MADPFELTTFDGHSIGPATVYNFVMADEDDIAITSDVSAIERRSAGPTVTGASSPGMTIVIRSDGPDNDDAAAVAYRQNINQWFDPNAKKNSAPRYLERYADDGSTLIRAGCYVVSRTFSGRGSNAYVVTLWSPQEAWEASSLTTSASDPSSVTNAGNTLAYPIVELTTSTHVTRRACTVTGAGAGGGLIAYPVVFALADADATDTNTFVYVEGVSVPCYVDDSGAGTSRVWALVDTASDGTTATNVDIIYGTGLANPLCQTLAKGGMDWDDATNCHNTQWEWNEWLVSSYPARPGTWRPGLLGNHNEAADVSYGIGAESASGVTFALGAGSAFNNAADSIRLHVGAKAGATNAFSGSSITTATMDGTNARAIVRYRVAGSITWLATGGGVRTNTTTSTSYDIDNAVEIAITLENDGATADPSSMAVSGSAVRLVLVSYPTVVVGAAEDMDHYDGVYTIGSRTITFTDFICMDDTLTIDCGARDIYNDDDGPFYGPENRITFSDADQWLVLDAGVNTVTDGLTVTDVIRHRSAYA